MCNVTFQLPSLVLQHTGGLEATPRRLSTAHALMFRSTAALTTRAVPLHHWFIIGFCVYYATQQELRSVTAAGIKLRDCIRCTSNSWRT